MAIPYSGTFTRSGGIFSAITKQLKSVTLKPVKKIQFMFDPFNDNVKHTRDFMFHISSSKIVLTNPSCIMKTEVLCSRADPSVTFNLINGDTVVFKSGNLTTLELFQLFNKYITPLAPVEQIKPVMATKSSKKSIINKRK